MNLKIFAVVIYTICFALVLGILLPASSGAMTDRTFGGSTWPDTKHTFQAPIREQSMNRTIAPINPVFERGISCIASDLVPDSGNSTEKLSRLNSSQFSFQRKPSLASSIASKINSQKTLPETLPTAPPSEEALAVVQANNQFAIDLYSRLATDPGHTAGNVFFSPWSISSALALTYEGARGTTADEIRSVFHFPSSYTTLREGYSEILSGLNSGDSGYSLYTANALWAEETHPFLPDYISTADQYYGAKTTNLDFVNEPEVSRATINRWVEDKTRDRIRDLIPEGAIDPTTLLVITNAIYFKGTWDTQFEVSNTQEEDFHVTPSLTVRAPMMKMTSVDAGYSYAETDTLQVLGMPYAHTRGKGLSMLVLLPKDNDLEAMENELSAARIAELNQALVHRQVNVYFPRFRMETSYSLSDTLAGMGMPSAFGGADFSGMDGTKGLFIDTIFHKAFVDVNEEGTEAAAATAVIAIRSLGPMEPIPVFRADHPFLFLIQDNDTGNILFIGRVVNPTG